MAVLNGGFVQYARVESECSEKPAHCRIEQGGCAAYRIPHCLYALVERQFATRERVLIHGAAGAGLAAPYCQTLRSTDFRYSR